MWRRRASGTAARRPCTTSRSPAMPLIPSAPAPTHPPTLGLVLAGGLARRMGGGDKALIAIGGTAILDRVIVRLRPHTTAIILNANGDPARFARFRLPVVADSVPDFAGPLAGILAGLDWAAAHAPGLDWIASAPGDCPFLPHDLIPRLHQVREAAGTPLACARSGDWRHPVVGLWPVVAARRSAPRAGRGGPAQDRGVDGAARHRHRRMAGGAARSVLQRQYAGRRRRGGTTRPARAGVRFTPSAPRRTGTPPSRPALLR